MDDSLARLKEEMPPLKNPRSAKVDWTRLEQRVGLNYPTSFKEYVSVYGGSIWCGQWCPLYDEAKDEGELEAFMETIVDCTERMRGKMKSWDYSDDIELPLYPEKGGLLPFLVDYDNSVYSWRTTNSDPDKWPVVCWVDRRIAELRGISIAGMFLEWIQRKGRMKKVWGDVNDMEPHRLKLDRD